MNTLALLPNLAGPDMLIIFLIVLIMFGAKKLPELARGLGQAVKEFSKAKEDVNNEFNRAAYPSHPSPHSEDPHLPLHDSHPESQGSSLSSNAAPAGSVSTQAGVQTAPPTHSSTGTGDRPSA